MMTYTCPTCHRPSYSAAGPDTANGDKCPYAGCDGRVVPVEPVKPKVRVIPFERKHPQAGDKRG